MEKNKKNIKPFDGEKYSIWKFRIRAVLSELEVLKVIDEQVPTTIDENWVKSELVAKNLIIEYLSDSFLGFAQSEITAKEILRNLDAIYERKSLASQLAARKKLLCLKLKADDTLLNHFQVFEDLVSELIAAGGKMEEMDKVSHLLLTMPSSYDGVITAIETLTENSITLSFVKIRLLDHEIKLKESSKDTSVKILQAVVKNDYAFKKNKFNNNFKKFKNNHANKKITKCFHCGKLGHVKKNCFAYQKQLTSDGNKKGRTMQTAISQPTENFVFMMSTIHDHENNAFFLLDSGASDHIINDINLYEEYVELKTPIKITVAKKGAHVYATKKGKVKLSNGLQLEDVLYSPDATQNLISVKKMQEAGITTTFAPNGVTIQKNGKILESGNVLKLKTSYNLSALDSHSKNYKLWHERLGHISSAKFIEMKNKNMCSDMELVKNVEPDKSLCEACIEGKQARLRFEKSKKQKTY